MKKWFYRATQAILLCCLAATLPALAQDSHPQQKQAQKSEHHAQKPAAKPHAAKRPAAKAKPAARSAARPAARQAAKAKPAQRKATHAQPQRNARPAAAKSHAKPQPNRAARPTANRPQQRQSNARRPSHARPAQWGRPPAHRGSYQFPANDRTRLHSYYMSQLGAINRANRPVFRIGGYFPYADIGYLSPLPPSLYGTLPPPPPGYQMGYYDGYVVVYDPVTYFIASVIDLLQ